MSENREPLTIHEGQQLDKLFQELSRDFLSLVVPIIVTMFAAVLLSQVIPLSASSQLIQQILLYTDQPNDDATSRTLGSLLNAFILISITVLSTIIILFLYNKGCTSVLTGWFCFSAFIIFFVLGFYISLSFVKIYHIPIDIISFIFVIFNFSVLGVAALFFIPNPDNHLTHFFLIVLSVFSVHFLSNLPKWSLFSFIILISVYDIYSVLHSRGPLRHLTEAVSSSSSSSSFPGLVYVVRGQVLGLGDFFIYSLLAIQAYEYSFYSALLCISAIITGLIITLFVCSLLDRTMPALPISVFGGLLMLLLSVAWFSKGMTYRVFFAI
ncbi:hypothetical protein GEMRC1_004358 [Eukaryota sp. GEM-RC1]